MEYWDIYDKNKVRTGRIMKRNDWCLADDEYHLTVLGVVRHTDGRFLITKRKMTKHWAPGWWEVSGGGVMAGEESKDAVFREVKEETGLDVSGASGGYLFTYHRENPGEGDNYFVDVYRFTLDFDESDLNLQEAETDGYKLATLDEIKAYADEGIFLHYDSIKRAFEIDDKFMNLKKKIRDYNSVGVAFSGGVDSTFLLKVAHSVLGDKCRAITIQSNSFPKREYKEAMDFCETEKIALDVIPFDELSVPEFVSNTPDRCYHCKKAMFTNVLKLAGDNQLQYVIEGSNVDDDGDYRPGKRAIKELQVKSPLKEAGLDKEDIRILSRELGVPTWNKPSYACLASRIPYGNAIDKELLLKVEVSEQVLYDLGFKQFRVRVHSDVARIELFPADFPKIMEEKTRNLVTDSLKKAGFSYVTLDLLGFRSGSMNETLNI